MFSSIVKHCLHCTLLLSTISYFVYNTKKIQSVSLDPWVEYGTAFTICLFAIRLIAFFALPQMLSNFMGLIFYNAFPDKVVLKGKLLLAPFICIRVVTRGDYPDLVKKIALRNINTCLRVGLEHFLIEVVTDKPINIAKHRRIREVVVPTDYKTKTGAMFKSRALQYCLEDDVNTLNPNDWIVHLDEETILTDNCVRGITNFVLDGKYPFGQGLITYANENVVNWVTTLADSLRVSDDMGKVRFQLKTFHKPLFSWKGSYVVSQLYAERDVSFDNGPDGSVAEDCFFAMKAFSKGYSFDWIEGEMYEKSPFTLMDFIQQRKRWLQGILLVVHSKVIPFKYKMFLTISAYSWCMMPFAMSNVFFAVKYPLPSRYIVDLVCAFVGGISVYMYIFGTIKSFTLYRFGLLKMIACVIGSLCTLPLNLITENTAVIWGVLTNKHKFYVVNKQIPKEAEPLIVA